MRVDAHAGRRCCLLRYVFARRLVKHEDNAGVAAPLIARDMFMMIIALMMTLFMPRYVYAAADDTRAPPMPRHFTLTRHEFITRSRCDESGYAPPRDVATLMRRCLSACAARLRGAR